MRTTTTRWLNTLLLAAVVLIAAPAWAAPKLKAALDPKLFGTLDQFDTACPELQCGPVALVNAFVYLQNAFPKLYGQKLIPPATPGKPATPDDLVRAANDIGDRFTGNCVVCTGESRPTSVGDFVLGGSRYLEAKAPGKTRYEATSILRWGQSAPAGDGPNSEQDEPAWFDAQTGARPAFLAEVLGRGSAVALLMVGLDDKRNLTGAHYVTLTGIEYDPASRTGAMSFVDPVGGARGTTKIVSPPLAATLFMTQTEFSVTPPGEKALSLPYIAASFVMTPVPEPSTVAAMSAGLFAAALLTRRKMSRRDHPAV